MPPPDMRRLKQLEDENAKLRKLVADLSPDREMLQDVIRKTVRPACKREQVDGVRSDRGVSIRRACRVPEMDTSTYHYKSHACGSAAVAVSDTQGRMKCPLCDDAPSSVSMFIGRSAACG